MVSPFIFCPSSNVSAVDRSDYIWKFSKSLQIALQFLPVQPQYKFYVFGRHMDKTVPYGWHGVAQ